ncbi:MAG: nuclear transport factor 2 family protein [Armatimonadetes bacterium]|nr:nuclear transport factor 2 family protein [Anaerolineae bacterium]
MKPTMILALLGALLLASCGTPAPDPADAVERYLTAKIASDEPTLRALLCSSKEADLAQEVASFASVEARMDGMVCQRDGDSDVVRCEGQIIAVYGGEDTVFPLTSYRVAQEDGVWKWCGEAG